LTRWVKIDGKVFNLEKPVIFGTIYIPPEYTRYSSDEAFNQIEHELHSLSAPVLELKSPTKPTYLELADKECNSCSIWLKASSEEYLVY
jgi:hypothetical protein